MITLALLGAAAIALGRHIAGTAELVPRVDPLPLPPPTPPSRWCDCERPVWIPVLELGLHPNNLCTLCWRHHAPIAMPVAGPGVRRA